MIKNQHKFSEIKQLIINFKDYIDDYAYAGIIHKYAKMGNSNVVF